MRTTRQKIILVLIGVTIITCGSIIALILYQPIGMKEVHIETFTIDEFTGKQITNDSAYPILLTENHGLNVIEGAGTNFFVNLTPDQQNSLQVAISTKGYDIDREKTFNANQQQLTTCVTSDIFGTGERDFVCGIDSDNWEFKYANHISFVSYVHKKASIVENKTLPIIYMQKPQSDDNSSINQGNNIITKKVSLPDGCVFSFDYNKNDFMVKRIEVKSGICSEKEVSDYANSYVLTEGTNVGPAPNPTLVEARNCNSGDIECIKGNFPQNYNPSSLTESTNCPSSGPCNPDAALTYGTEMQMHWAEIQDQNKKILENQNIMMCLEVVKSPNNWVDIGKYLTERGVNCTGLEIK